MRTKSFLYQWVSLLFCSLINLSAAAQIPGRIEQDISQNDWKLWLDSTAVWQNDTLYAPPVDLKKLPINPPIIGWNGLNRMNGKIVHLPATVEEYYWGANGNDFGVAGNYLGVSWFTSSLKIPATMKDKKVVLQFESARFRAEVFVNRQLVGYDLVAGTPFEADISQVIKVGPSNEVAVRITDPNGNFDWRDSQNFMWGDYRTQPTHGFGGITGRVKLVATDKVFIEDVFVKNKPALREVDINITSRNGLSSPVSGSFITEIKEDGGKQQKVYERVYPVNNIAAGSAITTYTVNIPNAKLWSVDSPYLYLVIIKWKGKDGSADSTVRHFGFRWFEVRNIAGDQQFYLNNKRIVLRTSISWGFWPGNGISPTDELAKKQIWDAKRLGLNMLNFHRAIGQNNVLSYADQLGLLYFEEPGGNQYPDKLFTPKNSLEEKQSAFYLSVRTEKFLRMVKRDRSHPSLVIYNMHNERGALPGKEDKDEMMAAHNLDESRIITYNSSNGNIKINDPDPKFKLHLLPYDTVFYDYGWFDQHHAGGPGVYHDNLYNSPTMYAKYTNHKDEIIYYGEEGAIGTPPRLQLIRETILKKGKTIGWESAAYLKWYDAYDKFLKTHGFSKAYPNVDSLTLNMGNVAYYYQGRTIENVRINNFIDGYAVNGWESMKLENHSGIVDNYRNLKGNPDLIARYNQPLYVAVKMNRKVLSAGDTSIIDFFLVNEKNVHGNLNLEVTATNKLNGKITWHFTVPVKVSGGSVYGELLSAQHKFVASGQGYTTISAELKSGNSVVARGQDELYTVQLNTSGIPSAGSVADTSGVLTGFFKSIGISSYSEYHGGRPPGKYLLIGAFEPQQTGNPLVTDILEWVNDGNTLIIVNNAEHWADHLGKKEVIDYRGAKVLGNTWYGGNFFSKEHSLFKGLPQACVFNWEYQCFATYNKSRIGLRILNGDPIVACVADHKPEVYSALNIIHHGRGKIILCTLDIFSCIRQLKMEKNAESEGENASMNTFNTAEKNSANIVGQQLLLNMIRFSVESK